MEANENNQSQDATPDFEKDIIQDTQNMAQTEAQNKSFAEGLGLPVENSQPQAPEQVTPEQPQQQVEQPAPDFTNNEVPQDNDQVRYQYWQSKAAKLENQVKEMEQYAPMVDYLRNNPEAVKQVDSAQHAEESGKEGGEEFPPPPERPEPPLGFNRDEAINDPSSESAQYVQKHEQWRDDMQTYQGLSSQYQIAQLREEYATKFGELEKREAQRKQHEAEQNEMVQIRQFVNRRYHLEGNDLDDFINTMSDPKSLNMDDLVGYYQYKKGSGNTPPASQFRGTPPPANTPPAQPSSDFNQIKRAQSVPTSMGVETAAPQTGAPKQDFMDLLINDNNNKNVL